MNPWQQWLEQPHKLHTAMLCDLIERSIRREIPGPEVDNITDNIGLR